MIVIFDKLRLILRMGRLHFLIFGFLLYLLGFLLAAFSEHNFDLTKFFFGYIPFSFAHLSVSFSNDYYDQQSDKTSSRTMFSGGSRVLVEHPHLQITALKIAVMLLVLSAISLILFTISFNYSYWLILFGITGGLLGWFYTAPPLKLSYRGFGEIATMIAVGLLMPGMGYFVATGTISYSFILFMIPLSAYGLFFIISVELPDLESDMLSKKRNLVVIIGRKKANMTLIIASTIGTLSLLIIDQLGLMPFNLIPTIALSTLPFISAIICYISESEDRRITVKQVFSNMTSLIILIFGMNINLLIQYLIAQLSVLCLNQ